jgi:predicted O-methyltransferase YrrM
MYDLPYENMKPPSHFQQLVNMDQRDSVLSIKNEAFGYMDQLTGWCTKAKASVLIDIILKMKPETVVEIGVWGGKSLIPMACAMRANGKGQIHGIDPWDSQASIQGSENEVNKAWWGSINHDNILRGLIVKMYEFGLEDYCVLTKASSQEATPVFEIEVLHIDGNHANEMSLGDVKKWVPLMKHGGWIILDDISWYENGVYQSAAAVDWLNKNCIKLAEFSDDSIWGIWIRP